MIKKWNIDDYRLSDNKNKNNEIVKLLAILFMVIDHIGAIIFTEVDMFRIIGRLAFPIFAYQIAQGYIHTSNSKKYMFRLWIFALVAQIPFTLAFNTYDLNVMFTFLLSLFLIDKIAKKEYYWIFTVVAIPFFVHSDYGLYGVLMPVGFYLARNKKIWAFIITSILTLVYMTVMNHFITIYAIVGIIIALYFPRHELKIRMNKYFFYWFYPIHILILFIIRMTLLSMIH